MTLRNDDGLLRLQSQGARGINIAATTGNVTLDASTVSTSSTTGALVCPGGVGIAKDLYVGGSIYTNANKVATESFVTTGLSGKQNLSPLLDNISSLTPADGTFLMGGNGGFFRIVPKDEILSAYQPLISPSSSLNLSGLMAQNSNPSATAITLGNTSTAQTWGIHVSGSSNGTLPSGVFGLYSSFQDKGYVLRLDPSGNLVVSGGLGVSTDAYIGGMLYIAGIEAATQKFVIDNIAPISQSLSSLTTTVTNNNNAVNTALATKQPMNATTNSLYTMMVLLGKVEK
ncbi:uncharacterized protein SPPG_00317 [Spizellomyces punctatus DAOM BR117]|uniref:Uncharacterized protein n=1 Tax=Spizellomyces punctatus (strain DAOM BR117) TaxID=645134 RepID=A0A0L0HTD9_SPIPD|nr:uncharacterized protein SPPG_00317 [Spizellomyces punctatus DAOM BR117]KND04596.1 hypothetical protein SPPG_00317 [Spizellomyces punctatus DAOM BR117]|eukprot:XP_016612635.1 hypothetical protein SPPG_00317 [Spizellomyces punctatus DAOM BR117]